jgi:K+-sensing histidine kinase KdpD
VVVESPSRIARMTLRGIAIGLLATLVGTILAASAGSLGASAEVAIFMLAVTVAAVSGGLWAGVVSALLASVTLPIIQSPDHVLRFDQLQQLIAAVVFLAIAVVLGLLVGHASAKPGCSPTYRRRCCPGTCPTA